MLKDFRNRIADTHKLQMKQLGMKEDEVTEEKPGEEDTMGVALARDIIYNINTPTTPPPSAELKGEPQAAVPLPPNPVTNKSPWWKPMLPAAIGAGLTGIGLAGWDWLSSSPPKENPAPVTINQLDSLQYDLQFGKPSR